MATGDIQLANDDQRPLPLILAELHRVLKRDGTLSFNDHHMHEMEILSRVTSGHLFKLARKGKRTWSFSPQDKSAPEGSV